MDTPRAAVRLSAVVAMAAADMPVLHVQLRGDLLHATGFDASVRT